MSGENQRNYCMKRAPRPSQQEHCGGFETKAVYCHYRCSFAVRSNSGAAHMMPTSCEIFAAASS